MKLISPDAQRSGRHLKIDIILFTNFTKNITNNIGSPDYMESRAHL